MGSIDEDGFLSDEIERWIDKHHQEYADWFALCEDLNRFCQNTMLHLNVHTTNKQEILAAVLFIRILGAFQASILMVERGMINEARVVVRSLLEALFTLTAISKDTGLADNYIRDDENQQLKALRKIEILRQDEKHGHVVDIGKDEIDRKIAELQNIDKVQSVAIEELSKKAGLHSLYLIAYFDLSSTAHLKIRDLESHLRTDKKGDLSRFAWGPDAKEIEDVLYQAIEFTVFCLIALHEIFRLDIKPEIDEFVRRYREFGQIAENQDIGK